MHGLSPEALRLSQSVVLLRWFQIHGVNQFGRNVLLWGHWFSKVFLSIQCSLVGQHPSQRTDFSYCEGDVLVSNCFFSGISWNENGGALFLEKATIGFSLIDSVLTNCTGQNGGGVYCRSKTQFLSNLCFNSCLCTVGNVNAAYLHLADKYSTENREIISSSFVSCYETVNGWDTIELFYGIDHTEDTNMSACNANDYICLIYNYKGFFSERCTFSNDMSTHQIWSPPEGSDFNFKQWNVCNNTQRVSGGALFVNYSPMTCEECIFIQNTFSSLSVSSNMFYAISCKFYANIFSEGTYATALPLFYPATAMCINGRVSWRFSFRSHEAFSLWKVFNLSIVVHILLS